jgi:hypothetical protein
MAGLNNAAPINIPGLTFTAPSNADLSASQFCMGKLGTTGKVSVSAANSDVSVGVILNDPNAADMEVLLGAFGLYGVKAGAAFNAGVQLTTDSSGRVIATSATGDFIVGISKGAAGGANEIVPVLVGPMGIKGS